MQGIRWTVSVTFEVKGDSVELALEATKQSLKDFPRPLSSVCLHEFRLFDLDAH